MNITLFSGNTLHRTTNFQNNAFKNKHLCQLKTNTEIAFLVSRRFKHVPFQNTFISIKTAEQITLIAEFLFQLSVQAPSYILISSYFSRKSNACYTFFKHISQSYETEPGIKCWKFYQKDYRQRNNCEWFNECQLSQRNERELVYLFITGL